ncbi:Putative kinetochore-associated protein Dsn1/Mis13 [Septoria linicola]|uniref:Kinetochore-associated protein Dsn1/Mis13 n=1 Tax=Septoria linicola TaxID=215465 RepID=A0A9Q9AK55_9PEZI|nr:putative kinetochore-associated protein Dsn1/Mis13 [Septoria linicola]USW47421.1 Putative kinetochore-associated protein Dsn1/Mis13 [Septoria linicola]
MSIVLTRIPLEVIGMNGGASQKRRSARLSGEGNGDNEPPTKKAKVNGGSTTTITTKQQDDGSKKLASRKKKQEYTDQADDFQFARKGGKRKKASKDTVTHSGLESDVVAENATADIQQARETQPEPVVEEAVTRTVQKKNRRRLPTTPERDVVEKPTRRSKRISDERPAEHNAQSSPQRPVQAGAHRTNPQSPSPGRGRLLTVEKSRRDEADRRDTKVMQIALPFADTPIQRRNKEMRKTSAEGHRRSSTGMRGKRASSVIDEGRGNALPHAEVPATEFYKHISADITEPRRMRSLLGWCGTRLLPSKPHPPLRDTSSALAEFQAQQAAHAIQEELSQSLMMNGTLSDWFSRDESVPTRRPLRKKANPRNLANREKVDELERELERLTVERAEWDALTQSAGSASLQPAGLDESQAEDRSLSPVNPDVLDSPQRTIFEKVGEVQGTTSDPTTLYDRLRAIANDLEFTVDQWAHSVHSLSTIRETAERVAEKSLSEAAGALEEKERQRAKGRQSVDQMDALRGLARVLNSQQRR